MTNTIYVAMRLQRWSEIKAHIPFECSVMPMEGSEGMLLAYRTLKQLKTSEPKGTKHIKMSIVSKP